MVLFFAGIFIGVIFGFLACAVLTASKDEDSRIYPAPEESEQKGTADE